jgi:hypothetical protein
MAKRLEAHAGEAFTIAAEMRAEARSDGAASHGRRFCLASEPEAPITQEADAEALVAAMVKDFTHPRPPTGKRRKSST